MLTANIKKIIESNPVAMATCLQNKPHVIAVADVKVIGENQILITDNFMKISKQNVLKNNHIALAVWDKKGQGYGINGLAKYYDKGNWLSYIKNMKENKGYPAKGAILIKIKELVKLG